MSDENTAGAGSSQDLESVERLRDAYKRIRAEMGKFEFAQTLSTAISASRPANSEIAVRHCSKEKTSGLACSARQGTGRSIGVACPWRSGSADAPSPVRMTPETAGPTLIGNSSIFMNLNTRLLLRPAWLRGEV